MKQRFVLSRLFSRFRSLIRACSDDRCSASLLPNWFRAAIYHFVCSRDSIKTTRTVSGTPSCTVSLAFEVSAAIPWARLPPRSFLGQSLKLKPQLTLFRMLVWPARSRARSQPKRHIHLVVMHMATSSSVYSSWKRHILDCCTDFVARFKSSHKHDSSAAGPLSSCKVRPSPIKPKYAST